MARTPRAQRMTTQPVVSPIPPRRIRTVVEAIIAANYMADEMQVEQLAAQVAAGDEADQTYFRVILAHMQSRLGRPRRGRQPDQEPVLDAIHQQLYPAALRGIGPEDMDKDERNRRGTKFRTAASTIRFFIQHGGDVRAVDVSTVTKTGLRKSVQPESQAPEGETRTQKTLRRARQLFMRNIERLARGNPDEARNQLEAALNELEDLLEKLPAAPDTGVDTTTIAGHAAAGTPRTSSQPTMLHQPAGG